MFFLHVDMNPQGETFPNSKHEAVLRVKILIKSKETLYELISYTLKLQNNLLSICFSNLHTNTHPLYVFAQAVSPPAILLFYSAYPLAMAQLNTCFP